MVSVNGSLRLGQKMVQFFMYIRTFYPNSYMYRRDVLTVFGLC